MPLKLSIIGTGYVGLVSAACFAEHGHDVTCVDVDPTKVDAVNAGESFLHEPDLGELLKKNVPARLRATLDLAAAVRDSEVTIIAVPTPFDMAAGRIDLSFVLKAAAQIGEVLREKTDFHTVIVKSTCVPGTTDGPVRDALEAAGATGFGLACSPEFLSEGTAVYDFLHADRLVLGANDERAADVIEQLHAGFEAGVPRLRVNTRTAEAIKYASNAYLAACISFANEVANLCEAVGEIDANDVMEGVATSRYLTKNNERAAIASFLRPGCGYGGSCLPKDVAALVAHGERLGQPMPLLSAVAEVNNGRAGNVRDRLTKELGSLNGKTVAVLGTAFKPGTADLRLSPAEPILRELKSAGAACVSFDPLANDETRRLLGGVTTVADSLDAAISRADAVVIATAWPDFDELDAMLAAREPAPVVFDGRRMLVPDRFARYVGVGLRREQMQIGITEGTGK